MSNVNFLNILKEEKQRILKLHEKSGYKNKTLKEQSEEELKGLNQGAQAELRDFYRKFPDCVRFVTKGYPGSTTKLSPNKTGIFVIFKGKSGGVTFYPPLQGSNYGRYYDTISKKTNYYYCDKNTIKYGQPPNRELEESLPRFPSCLQDLTRTMGKYAQYTKASGNLPEGITVTYQNGVKFYYSGDERQIVKDVKSGQFRRYNCNGPTLEYPGTWVKTLAELTDNQTTNASSNDSGEQQTVSSQGSDKNSSGGSVKNTNYVTNTQTSLENAGFSVGSKGADGRVGSDTLTAINQLISKYSELATKQ